MSFSTCLGWNLLAYNQPVDISSSYHVFYILTCSTIFLSALKCPRNAFSTHLPLFKESVTAKHASPVPKKICWSTLLGFLLFQKAVYMCSVSAPSHDFFWEYLTISSLDWDAPSKGCSHLSAPTTNFTKMLPDGFWAACPSGAPRWTDKLLCSREQPAAPL